jgi:hypothetical protein
VSVADPGQFVQLAFQAGGGLAVPFVTDWCMRACVASKRIVQRIGLSLGAEGGSITFCLVSEAEVRDSRLAAVNVLAGSWR